MNTRASIGIGLCSAGMIALWVVLASRDPLEVAANRIIGCIERGDARCLQQYDMTLDHTNVVSNGATLQKVIREYAGPVFAELHSVGPVRYESNPGYEQGIASRKFVRKDGERITLGVVLHIGDDGPVAPYLVSQVIMFVQEAKYMKPARGEPRVMSQARSWLVGSKRDHEMLYRLGVVKMVRTNKEGAMDWPAYIALQESRLASMEAAAEMERKQGKISPAETTRIPK